MPFSITHDVFKDIDLQGAVPPAGYFLFDIIRIEAFSQASADKLGKEKFILRLNDPTAGPASGSYENNILVSVPENKPGMDKQRKGSGANMMSILQATMKLDDDAFEKFYSQFRAGAYAQSHGPLTDAWFLNRQIPCAFFPRTDTHFDGLKFVPYADFLALRAASKTPTEADFDKYTRGERQPQQQQAAMGGIPFAGAPGAPAFAPMAPPSQVPPPPTFTPMAIPAAQPGAPTATVQPATPVPGFNPAAPAPGFNPAAPGGLPAFPQPPAGLGNLGR